MLAAKSGSSLAQILVIVAAGLLVVLIPFIFKAFRRLFSDVHDLKVAVAGDPKYGVPGLINTVSDLSKKMSANLAGTRALIVDKEPNDGSTMRDAVDRIEAEQKRHDPEVD